MDAEREVEHGGGPWAGRSGLGSAQAHLGLPSRTHGSCLMEGDPSQSDPAGVIIIKKDALLGRIGLPDGCWNTQGDQSAKRGGGHPWAEAHTGGACGARGGFQLDKSEQQPILAMPGPHTG